MLNFKTKILTMKQLIEENGELLAWPVPILTEGQLALMSESDARQAIADNYTNWERSREAVNEMRGESLAEHLTRKAAL